jgi:hypothetical protein
MDKKEISWEIKETWGEGGESFSCVLMNFECKAHFGWVLAQPRAIVWGSVFYDLWWISA